MKTNQGSDQPALQEPKRRERPPASRQISTPDRGDAIMRHGLSRCSQKPGIGMNLLFPPKTIGLRSTLIGKYFRDAADFAQLRDHRPQFVFPDAA